MVYLLVYLFNLIILTVLYDFGIQDQMLFLSVGIAGVLFVLWAYNRKDGNK